MESTTRGMPWLFLLLAGTSRVAAAGDPGAAIAAAGSDSGAIACASCHGVDGAGSAAASFPAL
ncbi:MAG: cytochrome c553, partial [Myxococcota bacterium]